MTSLDDDPRIVAFLDTVKRFDSAQMSRLGDLFEAFKETANFDFIQAVYLVYHFFKEASYEVTNWLQNTWAGHLAIDATCLLGPMMAINTNGCVHAYADVQWAY